MLQRERNKSHTHLEIAKIIKPREDEVEAELDEEDMPARETSTIEQEEQRFMVSNNVCIDNWMKTDLIEMNFELIYCYATC